MKFAEYRYDSKGNDGCLSSSRNSTALYKVSKHTLLQNHKNTSGHERCNNIDVIEKSQAIISSIGGYFDGRVC